MKIIYLILFIAILQPSCSSNQDDKVASSSPLEASSKKNQLNVSILLDLSDRIIQPLEPKQKERDIQGVLEIVRIIKENMKAKGAFLSNDKIRVLFNPTPKDPNVNSMAKSLHADFSGLKPAEKKTLYDNIETNFESPLGSIYDLTINSKNWTGSDIWRFFKYDAKDCIEKDSNYRNILVIITDGYLYDEGSKDKQQNRTAYITPNYLDKVGFHDENSNWKEKFDKGDYGLISFNSTYQDLDILVLEVNPSQKHKNDEEIIRAYLTKWFDEMKVRDFRIFNTDLPENTKKRIHDFIGQ